MTARPIAPAIRSVSPRWLRRGVWLAWAVGLALLAWISLEPRFAPPGGRGGALAPDKMLHVLAYALFAVFPALAGIRWRRALAIGLALVIYGTLLELAQRWVPGRRFGWDDVLANAVGAAIGAAIAIAFAAWRGRQR